MERHTHRQFLAWMYWLEKEFNRPSRTDYYLMQIAAEVRRVLARNRNAIKIENFLMKFRFSNKKNSVSPEFKQTLTQWAKSRWIGVVSSFKSKGRK